jgi:penicillin G amidase
VKYLISGLKWGGLALGGLIVFAAVSVLIISIYLRGSLPQTAGEITVAGAKAPVTITRDKYGVPRIQAQSLEDALFGLGFVHGQDRLWQLELTRRIVSGRIAEIAGPPAATIDVYMRSLGLYRAAEQAADNLSPEARTKVEAYAKGVNAAMRAHKGPLPPEFTLAQVTPEPWNATDSVATVKSLALQLSANAFREAIRVRLLSKLTPEQLHEFYPPFPKEVADAWATAKTAQIKLATLENLGVLQQTLDLQGASNNWVVSGARSASGKPLLANDPHLGMTLPAIWYLAHLSWPGGEAAGGTVPGIPGMVTGRTGNMAFGLTTTGGDTQDIFIERLNPDNPNEYMTAEGPRPLRSRNEIIKVRFGRDRAVRIQETEYGPVIPAEDPRVKEYIPDGAVAALRWPALGPVDHTIETSLKILEANDASDAEIRKAFEGYRAPLQSWVYAGIDGSFGKIVPGPVPIRDPRQTSQGMVPSPGWTEGASWLRLTAYDEWPHYRNAAEGWYATANNKVVPDSHPHKIANEWDSETRFRRIEKLLGQTQIHSVETFKTMLRDTVDESARDAMPHLLAKTDPASPMARQALDLLRQWDFAFAADKPQPLIYAAWMRQFMKQLMADEMGDGFQLVWNYWPDFTLRVFNDTDGVARWCDDVTTADRQETCAAQLASSLGTALAENARAQGNDLSKWRWDKVHVARLSHLGFGQVPVLNWMFNMQVPVPGGANTIDRADHRLGSPTPFAAVHGSGFRGVSDLGAPEQSAYMIASGQSGNVYSPHYADLVPLWAKGDFIAVGRAAESDKLRILTLNPAQTD